jgi:hypothetical protein
MTTYTVTWKDGFTDKATFDTLEEAVKWAKMMRAMNYKEVKLLKVETTEMDF